jgi:uncharacterized protein (TIGR02246 family)
VPDAAPLPFLAGSPEELSAAFAAALAQGEVETALAMWIEDASILTAAGEPVSGREAIGAALRALVENGAQVEIELLRTVTAGDVALGLGTLTLSGTATGGETFRQSSSSAVIYSRGADGTWRIAIDAPWGLPASNGSSTDD